MTKKQQHFPHNASLDPQPVFGPCPQCQACVLFRVWINQTGWRELSVPQNAVTGDAHTCKKETL